jgi:hypothetical protein
MSMTGVPKSIYVSFDDYLYLSFDDYLPIEQEQRSSSLDNIQRQRFEENPRD